MAIKSKKEIRPLPFICYVVPMVLLALGGIADSIYLSISHYRNYTDIGYSSFCAISQAINCDTVSQSPYAVFIGVPVPVWGILGYAGALLLTLYAWRQRPQRMVGWHLLFAVGVFFSLYSVILALISTYFIHSYCIMCIASYGINLLLLFYAWLIRRRYKLPALWIGLKTDLQALWRDRLARVAGIALAIVGIAAIAAFPAYWRHQTHVPTAHLSSGLTEDGHPWIGALHPELEITEFADYLCFQCRKMHFYLRNLITRHPDRIRLIHRHFPMDHEANPIVTKAFHVGAARMALLALYAEEKGIFWQMNDALYAAAAHGGDIDLQELADALGIDKEPMAQALAESKDLRLQLAKDIWDGLQLKLTGTPAFLIQGEVYAGQIPAAILAPYLKNDGQGAVQ